MATLLHDLTFVQDNNMFGYTDGGEAVGNEDERSIFGVGNEVFENFIFGAGVKGRSGFIQYENRSFFKKGPGEGNFLPLTAGQFFAMNEAFSQHGFIFVGKFLNEFGRAGKPGRFSDSADIIYLANISESDVFAHGHVVIAKILKDDTNILTEIGQINIADVSAIY